MYDVQSTMCAPRFYAIILPMISIIIPIYNEARILCEWRDYYLKLKDKAEVIFIDGGSDDDSCRLAAEYGCVVSSPKGRAVQKNMGAQYATGDMLLFMHVDTFVSDAGFTMLNERAHALEAGCFSMAIMDEHPIFRVYERSINRRAQKKNIIDGDLGLFVKKEAHARMQGFKELALMDDIEFSERLRKVCRITVLPETISVSARRWVEEGFVATLWLYGKAHFKYYFGLKLEKV